MHQLQEDHMRSSRPTKSAKSGFTLIELMVVVSIIAIVAAAVVPSFSMVLHEHRQREAAQLIIQAVFSARSNAARTGKCHRVRVYPSADAADHTGTGGAVAVDQADQTIQCGQVETWTRISNKSVGPSVDTLVGDSHAGIVGTDISITKVVAPPEVDPDCDAALPIPDPNIMIFRADTFLEDNTERYFEVQAFNTEGNTKGITRYVRVNSSGDTKFKLCEVGF
jgi:prepilin-type N-terminal cleavage/methylation domain-containing protein